MSDIVVELRDLFRRGVNYETRRIAGQAAEEIERLRADAARLNKLEWMSTRYKVSIVDTGVLPYRVCLNGQVLANSLREAIDKCIDAAMCADVQVSGSQDEKA